VMDLMATQGHARACKASARCIWQILWQLILLFTDQVMIVD
jgi:hypothetical protein